MSMANKLGDGRPVLKCDPASGRTKQEFRKVCDINEIVKRAMKDGGSALVNKSQLRFADVSSIGDFHSVVQRVRAAEEAFESLPSALRSRFHNDPVELVSFISDSKNRVEAVKLGLVKASEPEPEPAVPAVVPPVKEDKVVKPKAEPSKAKPTK